MSRHARWIHRCLKIAKESDHLYFKHAALLIKSGRVVAKGINRHRKGGLANEHYTPRCHFHAEFDCLYRLEKKQIVGSELYVTGWLTRSNSLLYSKPCKHCQSYLKQFKLKAIYYSTPDDIYGKLVL